VDNSDRIVTEHGAAETPRPSRTSRPAAATGKIRAELNLEKWPAIWQPSKSKNEKSLRVFEREITNPDGSKVVSRVEVGYTHLGTLTTEDQRMFYALIKQWEDSTKPQTQVFFSDRLLSRILKKSWGTNVRDTIVKSLRKLRMIPLEWINSYQQRAEDGKAIIRERTPFTILSELKIVEREIDGSVNKAVGYFKFDDRILGNLLTNYTKPLLLETILKIKSDIGQLLYVHVDLMLARKDHYERRTKELFVDLGLSNPQYNRQYERYRALKNAVVELRGLRLSTGVLKHAAVEKTNDGLDYKVVFKKAVAAPELAEPTADEVKPAVVVNRYSRPKDALTKQGEQLARHFHRTVHGVADHDPQSKETGQAISLISQYGYEQAKFIIDYAAEKAAETGFKIQVFGGTLAYASRAVAAFGLRQKQPSQPQVRPRAISEVPAAALRTRGIARLAVLTEAQYAARAAEVKASLFRESPFLSQRWKPGSKLHEQVIRARVIRELDGECMELAPAELYQNALKLATPNFPL